MGDPDGGQKRVKQFAMFCAGQTQHSMWNFWIRNVSIFLKIDFRSKTDDKNTIRPPTRITVLVLM